MQPIPLFDPQSEYRVLRNEHILDALSEVLDKGIFVAGPEVKRFEAEMALLTGTKHAVSTANGTDSLILTLLANGIGPGDEVITSPFTFFATAEAIVRVGATPVFADIDERTYNLSPAHAEAKITERTKAIIPVHLFGQPADMDAFAELAHRYSLIIIEDACQAIGAEYKGKQVGSLGHAACLSFYPTKNLGGFGDGGMVTSNDDEMADRIRVLAFHGMGKLKYYHEAVGLNSRLDEIQALMLRIKMQKIKRMDETPPGTGTALQKSTRAVGRRDSTVLRFSLQPCLSFIRYTGSGSRQIITPHGSTWNYYCPLLSMSASFTASILLFRV
ncbi:dTDP-4-amino-4,6-dideoxygalactose transaminase [Paenibacillus sp. OAE614]